MKKLLPLGVALLALGMPGVASAEVGTEYYGLAVSSVSDNGEWMVCELDHEASMGIVNLKTGQTWKYVASDADGGENYDLASTRAVSNDGIVVGEHWNIPSYWVAGADGKGVWTNLKGYMRDESGYVSAVVGAITPDGSMIVGGLGKGQGSMTGDEDVQMTYPCVWLRQADGTYGDPVWLPNPGKDIFDRIPQYVHCLAVSQDGKTIGAMMRDGFGLFCRPYAYTLGDNGEWTYEALGMDLINPKGIEIVPFPGEDDSMYPNYEQYMTPEELMQYNRAADSFIDQKTAEGYSQEQIDYLLLFFAEDYMTGENKERYVEELTKWDTEFKAWEEAWEKYEKCFVQLLDTGFQFEFNNLFISPDGKYVYSSVKPQSVENFVPVSIEISSDKYQLYPNNQNILISCIAADHSILGRSYDQDNDWYSNAYIFPEGNTTVMELQDYLKEKSSPDVYSWMENHMYQGVVVSMTSSGQDIYEDRWVCGKPVCTPDMSIIAFEASTFYWETKPSTSNFISFVIETGLEVSGIEEIPVDETVGENEGKAEYYTLQGVRVDNPQHGIYIKRVNGKASKVVL